MAVFVAINLVGIEWFTRLNSAMVWWKLAIISIVVIAFLLTTFHTANFTSQGFAPSGIKGYFHTIVVAGIVFSFLGFRQAVELGGESARPSRDIPFAVIGSVVLTAVIYMALQVAFIGALSPGDLAHGWARLSFTNDAGPLAAIASTLGLAWLATLLYADAVVSPGDTGLIYTTVTARLSYAMARNRTAPEGLVSTSTRGVPVLSVALAWVVGVIIFLPFPSWNKLVGFVTSSTVRSFGSGALVLVYWAGWDVVWKLMASVGIGLVLLAAQLVSRREALPPMRWRNGWWVLPWFALLAVASWQGIYSSDGTPHGQQGNLPFGWDFLVILAISAAMYVVACRSRLSIGEASAAVAGVNGGRPNPPPGSAMDRPAAPVPGGGGSGRR